MLVTKQTGGKARSSSRTFPPAAPAAACLLLCAGALAGFARPAVAQTWDARGFLTINGGQQAASPDFSDNIAFTDFAEEGDFDARYANGSDTVFDAGGGIRVWRNLGIGAGVSLFSHTGDAGITARIPHPFFFDRHRAVDGTEPGFAREETAVHLQALWVIPASRSFHIVGVVVVAILVFAQPATAQTQVESFTTVLDSSSGFYFHRTTYAFTIPTKPTGHPDQEVTLDIYYNSRNVWLVTGSLRCSDLSWGETTSDSHFATVRASIPVASGTTCTAYLAFANNFGRTTPQSAAVRLNVSAIGQRALTKQSASADGRGGPSRPRFDHIRSARATAPAAS